MGKISDYTRVLAAKLADVFVVDQTDNGTTATKSATVEQIGTAIGKLQNFADLDTSNKNLVDAINEIASYTPVYNNTASGSIATFDTSLALPLQDLQIDINAVQESGTPTPSSPKLISGFTGANIKVVGKNLINITDCLNDYYVKSSDLSVSSIAGANVFYCDVPKNTDLVLTPDKSNRCVILGYKTRPSTIAGSIGDELIVDSPVGITSRSFNTGNNQFLAIYVNRDSANKPTQIMLEVGTVASAYQAYNSTTTAISWQSEAGTVYGGSLDVTSGVLTVTWGSVDMGSLTWTYDSTYHRMKSNSIADMKKVNTARTLVFMCPIYQVISDGRTIANVPNDSIYASFDSDQKTAVWVHDSDYSDANVFKTAMSGIYIVYPLETPVTYQLTPTQISAIVGTNNVFTDTNGNTSVVYACSLKDYIEGQ